MTEGETLRGSLRALFLYDVAEEIQLEALSALASTARAAREPEFKRPTPDYVRFERTPVMEPVGSVLLESGERFESRVKYYDYGVVSIEMELPFEGGWADLVGISNRWLGAPELERKAVEVVRRQVERVRPALRKPYESWLNEDYYIFQLLDAGACPSATELLSRYGAEVAQIVRGEAAPLSAGEQREILQSSISYYDSDLLVAGWTAALVWDTPAGAAPTLQLLEYANSQLLEFRHYDEVLTRVLAEVYRYLDEQRSFFSRWRLARRAEWLNTIRLDVTELTERTDNAIKFVSDMFYARLYRLTAAKVGVSDYRRLVEEKLRTAGELYDFMVNEFHQARAFVLELAIVLILIVDLVFLLRGAF